MRKKLLRVDEVAEVLSVSLARAYELIRCGHLPAVRLGRQLRVDEDTLLDWIECGGSARPPLGSSVTVVAR